ncbi:MAG: transcriptional regulator NrdR [Thermomicrobiales bacterium]
MQCPYCGARDSRVIDSRELSDGAAIRRRRECIKCHQRFTTYERIETVALAVVKKDGRREEFNPDKLRAKLRVALTKRPVSEETLDALVASIEAKLMAEGTREVPSEMIGELALRGLKEVDGVAYIRFASVYREFADLEDMRRELEGLDPGEVLESAAHAAGSTSSQA